MILGHVFKKYWLKYLGIFIFILGCNCFIPAGNFDIVQKAQAAGETLPIIYGAHPRNMTFTYDRKPSVTTCFIKGVADIDPLSLSITMDGKDVTESAKVFFDSAAQKGTVSYIPDSDLSYGEHDIKMSVSDIKGQSQEYSWFFVVDEPLSSNSRFYYGNPHSHTSYSDGLGVPAEAYDYAYNRGLDFLVLTDHSNMLEGDKYDSGTKEFTAEPGSEWMRTAETAQDFSDNHQDFLALRGFEMTFPELGHLNVFNTDKYVEAQTMTTLPEFYDWLAQQPGAIGEFAHPKWPETSFNSLAYSAEADRVINVIETANGRMPYSYTRMEEYYYKALDQGWHVGAVNVQDNHGTNWGETDNLTVVVADQLNEANFYKAYRQRRVYATESRTLELTFKGNGCWMGSVLDMGPTDPLSFDIIVADSKSPIKDVSLITNNGNIAAVHEVNGTAGEWYPQVIPGPGDSWYLVKVTLNDGRIGLSSPIFTTDDGTVEAAKIFFKKNAISDKNIIKTFADCENHWAKEEIEVMASKEIINGIGADEFAPDMNITRAQFAGILARAFGMEGNADQVNFSDVSGGRWFTPYIGAIEKMGLIKGYEDQTFRPNALVTKEEMAVMINRTAKVLGIDPGLSQSEVSETLGQFKDGAGVHDWAREAVAKAVNSGFIKGLPGGYFRPAAHTTRGEAAVIIKRMMEALLD